MIGLWACSEQGEGERCEGSASNPSDSEDCASGLVCKRSSELNNSDTPRCCPPDAAAASTNVCGTASSGPLDAAIPSDDATTGDATVDAGNDADAADAADASDAADAADAADADADAT